MGKFHQVIYPPHDSGIGISFQVFIFNLVFLPFPDILLNISHISVGRSALNTEMVDKTI